MTNAAGELRLGPRFLYPAKAALTRARSAAWLARSRGRPDDAGLRILYYHRVADEADELAVDPRRFREQMQWLAANGYRALDVVDAARLLADGVPSRTVALCFDDGYADVGEHAADILGDHGFAATVFVATGVTDGRASFPWYERQPRLLDWDEITTFDREGTLRFEAHTVTHPNLLAVGEEEARWEIEESKRELELRLGRPVTAFCYPAGLYRDRDLALVAAAGFELATTCEPGVNTSSTDPFALRRIQIDHRDSLLDFRAKVGGGHDRPLALRRAYRRARYGAGEGAPAAASSSE